MTKDKGFTLIEVVIVMGLIGIIISAAAPYFLSMSKIVNRAAHQDIVSTIRLAQTLSYTSEQIIRMDIDALNHCYGLYVISLEDAVLLSDENSPLRAIECGKQNAQGELAF